MWRCAGAQVDGIADPGCGASQLAQGALRGIVELGYLQAHRGRRVGGEHGAAAGVADDGEMSARKGWLTGEQRTAVEQLLQRVDADHPRLPEEQIGRAHV